MVSSTERDLMVESEFSEDFKRLLANCYDWVKEDFDQITDKVKSSKKAIRVIGKLGTDKQFMLNMLIASCTLEIKEFNFARDIIRAVFEGDDSKIEEGIKRYIRVSHELELKSYVEAVKRQSIEIAIMKIINNLGIQNRELPKEKREYKSVEDFFESLQKENFGRFGGPLKAAQGIPMAIQSFNEGDGIRKLWEKLEAKVHPLTATFGIPDENGLRKYCSDFYIMITLMLNLTYCKGVKFDSLVKSFNKVSVNNGVITDEMIDELEDAMVNFKTMITPKVNMNENGVFKMFLNANRNNKEYEKNKFDYDKGGKRRRLEDETEDQPASKKHAKITNHSTEIKISKDSNSEVNQDEDYTSDDDYSDDDSE